MSPPPPATKNYFYPSQTKLFFGHFLPFTGKEGFILEREFRVYWSVGLLGPFLEKSSLCAQNLEKIRLKRFLGLLGPPGFTIRFPNNKNKFFSTFFFYVVIPVVSRSSHHVSYKIIVLIVPPVVLGFSD